MKQIVLTLLLTIFSVTTFAKMEKIEIDGAMGKLRGIVTIPDDMDGKKIPTVIIFHGFTGNKYEAIHNAIADSLLAHGIASVRFDFNSHGESDGDFSKMSIDNELEDARRIYNYTRSLPFVRKIGIVGHSQGGVIAVLLSSELGKKKIKSVALLAPALVIRENMRQGSFFGTFFDPLHVPEQLKLFGGKITIGRNYVLAGQKMEPFKAAYRYKGEVCLIHGTGDTAVPYSYSEWLSETYKNNELHLILGADHTFTKVENLPAHFVAQWMEWNLK